MAYWKGGSGLCLMLCLAMVSANPNYFQKDYSFGKKHLIISKESLKETTLLYGVCDFYESTKPNGSCEVILETFNFDGTTKKLSCEVPLKTRISHDISMAHVGKDKAVLLALEDSLQNSEKQHVQLVNVDLSNCQTNYVRVAAPPTHSNWTSDDTFAIPYENTYDVIFIHPFATDDTNWKGTYDLQGKVVKEILPWTELQSTEEFMQMTNTKYQSPDGIYIIMRGKEGKLVTTAINDNGKQILGEWNMPGKADGALLFFDNNETVSQCMFNHESRKVECTVFESQGAVKDKITFDVVPYYFTKLLGEFFVLYSNCIDLTKPVNEFELPCKNSKLYIRRLNAEGKLVKEFSLDTFDLVPNAEKYSVQVFKNEAKDTCISYINFSNGVHSYLSGYPNVLKVAGQCFADL